MRISSEESTCKIYGKRKAFCGKLLQWARSGDHGNFFGGLPCVRPRPRGLLRARHGAYSRAGGATERGGRRGERGPGGSAGTPGGPFQAAVGTSSRGQAAMPAASPVSGVSFNPLIHMPKIAVSTPEPRQGPVDIADITLEIDAMKLHIVGITRGFGDVFGPVSPRRYICVVSSGRNAIAVPPLANRVPNWRIGLSAIRPTALRRAGMVPAHPAQACGVSTGLLCPRGIQQLKRHCRYQERN